MRLKRTPLQRSLKKYSSLFEDYEIKIERTSGAEYVGLIGKEYTIQFNEDLREHVVNFAVFSDKRRVVKVYFREIQYIDETLKYNELVESIKKLNEKSNCEEVEVDAYVNFLIINDLIIVKILIYKINAF